MKAHWEQVYETRPPERVGWYTAHLRTSLDWIDELGLSPDSSIIDVGGGASTLVDDLLDSGYRSITVLDISETALLATQTRLAERSRLVTFLCADIGNASLPASQYDLWHDRAAFHFLTEPAQRKAYRRRLLAALRPGGHVIIGTFAPEAPPRCSGLPVQRYQVQDLVDEFGPELALVQHLKKLHVTPGGVEQMYQYCLFRRLP